MFVRPATVKNTTKSISSVHHYFTRIILQNDTAEFVYNRYLHPPAYYPV